MVDSLVLTHRARAVHAVLSLCADLSAPPSQRTPTLSIMRLCPNFSVQVPSGPSHSTGSLSAHKREVGGVWVSELSGAILAHTSAPQPSHVTHKA